MIRTLLIRGMIVGAFAGLLAAGFASLFGEAEVDAAIAVEAAAAAPAQQSAGVGAMGQGDETAPVSRSTQKTIGLAVAGIAYGAALGGIFAVVFAFLQGRAGDLDPRTLAALLAAAGFVAVALVPFIKYPANPPAVSNPATLGERTELYFGMLLIALAAMAAAVSLGRALVVRHGGWNASLAGAAAFVVIAGVAMLVLPTVNEVPAGFPADVFWRFRVASLGTQAVLWAAIGLAFGALTAASARRSHPRVLPVPR
jgi:predicted cobalt transporter CbtA